MIIWTSTVLTTLTRFLRRGRNGTFSTWSTTMVIVPATTRPKVSSAGSAIDPIRPTGPWSSLRNFSSSRLSHWGLNFGQAENTTISVSITLYICQFNMIWCTVVYKKVHFWEKKWLFGISRYLQHLATTKSNLTSRSFALTSIIKRRVLWSIFCVLSFK